MLELLLQMSIVFSFSCVCHPLDWKFRGNLSLNLFVSDDKDSYITAIIFISTVQHEDSALFSANYPAVCVWTHCHYRKTSDSSRVPYTSRAPDTGRGFKWIVPIEARSRLHAGSRVQAGSGCKPGVMVLAYLPQSASVDVCKHGMYW